MPTWSGALTSQRTHAFSCAGAQQTELDGQDSDTSVIGGVGGRWQSERNRLFLDLTRTVGPVSAGTIVGRHQLAFGWITTFRSASPRC